MLEGLEERFVVQPTLFRSFERVVGFVDRLQLIFSALVSTGPVGMVLPGKGKPRFSQVVLRNVFGDTERIVEILRRTFYHGQKHLIAGSPHIAASKLSSTFIG